MKIVKGDTVYIRSGRDRAGLSRLRKALHLEGKEHAAAFRQQVESMPMNEQIERANSVAGIRGRVIRVLPREGKVLVEGLNKVTKHQKPRATSGAGALQQGGRIEMEAPIPVSRVMLVCPHCDKPTRVGSREVEETRTTLGGPKTVKRRIRVCKQCQADIERPTDTAQM
jgi:large subunit ribosomal protein L24